ncbi:uncharacterized protein LOC129260146 [Lytechinus pictus]|uniref:uncharacterized protein LOC129260146 n=1 Tax=Lytechinus pictus TaxID=7653 RepID=UPI0030B9ADB4
MFGFKRLRSANSEDNTEIDISLDEAPPNIQGKAETRSEVRSDNIESMLHDILNKVSVLENVSKKVDMINDKITNIELKLQSLDTRVSDLENGTGFLESEVEEIKIEIDRINTIKADYGYVNEMRKSVVDLVNRSKQNNVILHGIPEGEENSTSQDCAKYARHFFASHLHMENVEVERAHRTPRISRPQSSDQRNPRPRPIHVKLLRFTDREAILKKSPALKDVRIHGARIGISDDVHPDTRKDHQRLMAKVKELRNGNKFAFFPNSVPRVIKYKEGPKDAPGPLKTIRLSDLKNAKDDEVF